MGHLRRSAAAAVVVLASVALVRVPAGAAGPDLGEWSDPFEMGGVAIHATLTHTGDVLFFQYVEGSATVDHSSYIGTWNPETGVTAEAPAGYDRDMFCAFQNVLPDGRVFVAGGHDHMTGKKQSPIGAAETDVYDPVTRTWKPGPLLSQKRWYPTNVGLGNGKTLVFGGHYTSSEPANSVDSYDPVANTITQLPSTATLPMGLYPRMHLLQDGRVIRSGPQRKTMYFNPTTNTWSSGTLMMFGARKQGASVLLPGGKVLAIGGSLKSRGEPPTATAEILDTTAATPRWRYTASMNFPRIFPNAVTLPDGKVLVVGGGTSFKYGGPQTAAEMYDPATETWTVMASQQGGRVYHGSALLLPDGRVLSAGQDNGTLATKGEIYSPPYLFKGPRPVISAAPEAVAYGGTLDVTTPDAADIAKVTLIRAGSATHSVDSDQRSVPLSFTAGAGSLSVTAPTSRHVAPPGYYMLFIVDGEGVPSVASWVRLT